MKFGTRAPPVKVFSTRASLEAPRHKSARLGAPEQAKPRREFRRVLLDAILHDLRAMPHRTHVPVDAPHQCIPAVAELLPYDELGHWRAAIESLEARSAVRVAESLGANFTSNAPIKCETRRLPPWLLTFQT